MEDSKLAKLIKYFQKYNFVINDALIYNGLKNSWVYQPLFLTIKNLIKEK